jgi:hypothetical protein
VVAGVQLVWMFLVVIMGFLWENKEFYVGHVSFFLKFLNFIIGNFQSCFSVMLCGGIWNPELFRIPNLGLKHASEHFSKISKFPIGWRASDVCTSPVNFRFRMGTGGPRVRSMCKLECSSAG